ncbi:DUF4406 domain-containing protein [Achromobacter piechaudii]|uniref:DUF4406 domain-containing protein n=1 Tax=Achromobacter piechaudii TaxID=72556 RepID=UPI003DA9F421
MTIPYVCSSTRGMRTYLAGPITGHPDFNFPLFHADARRLRTTGYDVVNPAEINVAPATCRKDCTRAGMAELVKCDAIAMLPGWQQSRGANHIASRRGWRQFTRDSA